MFHKLTRDKTYTVLIVDFTMVLCLLLSLFTARWSRLSALPTTKYVRPSVAAIELHEETGVHIVPYLIRSHCHESELKVIGESLSAWIADVRLDLLLEMTVRQPGLNLPAKRVLGVGAARQQNKKAEEQDF